jgi:hypothetical protein
MPTGLFAEYDAIQSNLFVRLNIKDYRTSSSGSYTNTVLRFSDSNTSFVIDGETYTALGNLLSITNSSSELRVSSGELTITISGIPNSSIAEIVNSKIKGSPVTVFRALFDPTTGDTTDITGPFGRYVGFVNNYSLQEEYDVDSRTATNTLVLICNSSVDVLSNKFAGRRTNPASNRLFFPNDAAMDRVPNLKDTEFNFGAAQ